MGKLVYVINISLDGFFEDADGNFDYTEPNDEQHRFINDLIRPIGIHLYGRRMYETMAVWENDTSLVQHSPITRDFAEIWQAADKVVYSRTLDAPVTERTRIERELSLDVLRKMKASEDRDIAIGGPELAAHAIRAGLVDEYHFFVAPVAIGAGKHALPPGFRLQLELKDEQCFSNGVVYLHYTRR